MNWLNKLPYPWFGGKSRAAELIWSYLGECANHVSPFFGGGGVELKRPWVPPRYETWNDLDPYISNFWRAVHAEPAEVVRHADWPINEVDLTARHRWLCQAERKRKFNERMLHDPDYYCTKTAGWWVWGLSQWIGAGWCQGEYYGPAHPDNTGRGMHGGGIRPDQIADKGVHGTPSPEMMVNSSRGVVGVPCKRPHLHNPQGVMTAGHSPDFWIVRPHLSTHQGILSAGATNRPHLNRFQGMHSSDRRGQLTDWMEALCERLRYVRVTCGDWSRVLGKAVLSSASPCSVLLDPPYSHKAGRDMGIYRIESGTVAYDVLEWCKEHGDNKDLRIALCGYEGEGHEVLEGMGWTVEEWTASGGYGKIHGGKAGKSLVNRHKERIWFSPHCLGGTDDMALFQGADV